MKTAGWVVATIVLCAAAAGAQDLREAEQLAWSKQFAAAEARYREAVAQHPRSRNARLGLARVILWQQRYAEAMRHFDDLLRERPDDVDAREGRAQAAYWSGDLRSAARDFARVLAREPQREESRRALAEIRSLALPSQRISIDAVRDDQPLDGARGEASATFFSDPLTRWSATGGAYRVASERRGTRTGEYVLVGNETNLPRLGIVIGGSIGAFEFPDGAVRPIGSAMVRWRQLTLRVDRREELAAATALVTHAASTTTTLRWARESDRLVAAAEASRRQFFDDNASSALVAYAVTPVLRRNGWTLWSGASVAARDTDESRFAVTATSSSLDPSGTFFHYTYRGEYDPYWTPNDLREGRIVLALERAFGAARVKVHGDGGWGRDRGIAFGPNAGLGPFPRDVQPFGFDRTWRPWRAGVSGDVRLPAGLRLEIGYEHGVTVDYRSDTFHAAVVRTR